MNKLFKNILIFVLLSFSFTANSKDVLFGSKSFSESQILSEILGQLLEKKYGHQIHFKHGLGGTKVAFDALTNQNILAYPEYTGTGHIMILKSKDVHSKEHTYQSVKAKFKKNWNIIWAKPLGFNNTYALAVKKDAGEYKNIQKLSELAKMDLRSTRYGAPYEFMERPDGHKEFVKKYGFNFAREHTTSMQAGLMYQAINNDELDMVITYSTDGRIKDSSLRLIEDDLGFFPPYQAAFIYNNDLLKTYNKKFQNDFVAALGEISGNISEAEMINLNLEVDMLKKSPRNVALKFLQDKQLVQMVGNVSKSESSTDISLINYFIKERKYLLAKTLEHLYISFIALAFGFILSVPLAIALSKKPFLAKMIFPVVNTIQTIPSLALLGFLIPILGIGTKPAIFALFLYSLLPLIQNIYVGISGIEPNYKEAAKGMGLNKFEVLRYVELPLAFPYIIAGVKTATVVIIGTATLAALIGAGGLGDPIFRGVSTVNSQLIMLGAIPSALLAVTADKLLSALENNFISRGIRG